MIKKTLVAICVILVTVTFAGCSATRPANLRQDGWYLRWDTDNDHSYWVAIFRDDQWRTIANFDGTCCHSLAHYGSFRLHLEQEIWKWDMGFYLQDGDQLRVTSMRVLLRGRYQNLITRTAHSEVITFVTPT